jgi:hypothetical protein
MNTQATIEKGVACHVPMRSVSYQVSIFTEENYGITFSQHFFCKEGKKAKIVHKMSESMKTYHAFNKSPSLDTA